MDQKPVRSPALDQATLAQLACPACYGKLRLESNSVLCLTCRRRYPIVNGIAVLILERAKRQGEER